MLHQKLGFLTRSGFENREVSITGKMGFFLLRRKKKNSAWCEVCVVGFRILE